MRYNVYSFSTIAAIIDTGATPVWLILKQTLIDPDKIEKNNNYKKTIASSYLWSSSNRVK